MWRRSAQRSPSPCLRGASPIHGASDFIGVEAQRSTQAVAQPTRRKTLTPQGSERIGAEAQRSPQSTGMPTRH